MKIVCLGDSITYGYECITGNQVDENYPNQLSNILNCEVINSGYPGYRVYDILKIIDNAVFKHNPDLCIVMLGINDARGSKHGITISCQKYLDAMNKLLNLLKDKNINVMLLSPTLTKNSRVKYFNDQLVQKFNAINMHEHCREFIEANNIDVDYFIPDGVHLNNQYYKIISDVIVSNWED